MSDAIQHECGLAFIRLRKPFSYYQQKYGTALFGLNKLYLLMEKQHNRGQDGAGLAAVVGPYEHGWMVQHDALTLAEALEVLNLEVVQQTHGRKLNRRRGPVRAGESGAL